VLARLPGSDRRFIPPWCTAVIPLRSVPGLPLFFHTPTPGLGCPFVPKRQQPFIVSLPPGSAPGDQTSRYTLSRNRHLLYPTDLLILTRLSPSVCSNKRFSPPSADLQQPLLPEPELSSRFRHVFARDRDSPLLCARCLSPKICFALRISTSPHNLRSTSLPRFIFKFSPLGHISFPSFTFLFSTFALLTNVMDKHDTLLSYNRN